MELALKQSQNLLTIQSFQNSSYNTNCSLAVREIQALGIIHHISKTQADNELLWLKILGR